jgi:hypothetical protein
MSDIKAATRWSLATDRDLQIIGYTSGDLQYMTGISKRTFDSWRYEGKGPRYMRVEGKKIIYPVKEFNEWWNKQKGEQHEAA